MNNNPLVSIIMPAYNAANTISDSIQSVLNQTYQNWELIIIDDGSKDKTESIIDHFASHDKRIMSIKNNMNKGVSKTRNRGIELSEGEWIAFLDSDDLWDNNKLEKQINYCLLNKYNFSFTGVKYLNENDIFYPGIFSVPNRVNYKQLKRQNVISTSSVLIRKVLIGNLKMEFDYLHEDYLFWLRILKQGHIAFGLNEPLLIYRISSSSKSSNKLKSVKMTYNVHKKDSNNVVMSTLYTASHLIKSVFKYKKIFKG